VEVAGPGGAPPAGAEVARVQRVRPAGQQPARDQAVGLRALLQRGQRLARQPDQGAQRGKFLRAARGAGAPPPPGW
jgi:hypothetical protein